MNAFCMLCGSEAFRFTRMAAESAIKNLTFDHAFLAFTEQKIKERWPDKLRALFPGFIKVHTMPGTDKWSDVARVRFGLFDEAARIGVDGWLFSADDDDVIIESPMDRLETIDPEIGMFHTNILAVCQQNSSFRKAGDVFVRDAQQICERIDANMFRGSFYGYRVDAWKDVSKDVDRSYTDYEEWRTVWHMIRKGWKDCHFPHVMQVQRVQDFTAIADAQRDRGRSWAMTCSMLESRYKTEDRYWENWDRDERRDEVEDFWKSDPNQVARRTHLYRIVREEILPKTKGDQMLDFGCGVCWDKPAFESMGYKYHGADVTPGMLSRAREKFPNVCVYEEDVLNCSFKHAQWPFVNCSAVIPHMPREVHQDAINTLWRITGKCLAVRLFGVDTYPDDETLILKGFLYNRFREETWMRYFKALSPAPSTIKVLRGDTKTTQDIMIVTAWK